MAKDSKRARDVEKVYTVRQFAAKLRRLADALETGKPFRIDVAGESIRVPAGATFNVEHEREAGQEEVEFQLKWKGENEVRADAPTKRKKKARG